VAQRFFDCYLRGGPTPDFEAGFPELTVETNDDRFGGGASDPIRGAD
jgi:hypothetical protein